jgi:hypothetical protein
MMRIRSAHVSESLIDIIVINRRLQMVDETARDLAAEAVARFAAGKTTNDEFENEYPDASATEDNAIRAVETMVWNLYSDHEVGRLRDLTENDPRRLLLDRCLRFLRSNVEYDWPINDFRVVRHVDPLRNLLTAGAAGRSREQEFLRVVRELETAGDFSAWPFLSHEDSARSEVRSVDCRQFKL